MLQASFINHQPSAYCTTLSKIYPPEGCIHSRKIPYQLQLPIPYIYKNFSSLHFPLVLLRSRCHHRYYCLRVNRNHFPLRAPVYILVHRDISGFALKCCAISDYPPFGYRRGIFRRALTISTIENCSW